MVGAFSSNYVSPTKKNSAGTLMAEGMFRGKRREDSGLCASLISISRPLPLCKRARQTRWKKSYLGPSLNWTRASPWTSIE
ncbi:hypothetical protein Ancab_031907, partial [Ancistrocladus abbreviatus]